MSGLYLQFSKYAKQDPKHIKDKFDRIASRGKNSSVLLQSNDLSTIRITKSTEKLTGLTSYISDNNQLLVAYAGLNIASSVDLPPFQSEDILFFMDGIITSNHSELNKFNSSTPSNENVFLQELNTFIAAGIPLELAAKQVLNQLEGCINALLIVPGQGLLLALSNHGSLYAYESDKQLLICSERSWLDDLGEKAEKIIGIKAFNILPKTSISTLDITDISKTKNLSPVLIRDNQLLTYKWHNLKRCSRCVLPETMPYITFDSNGVCNYCHTYKQRNQVKNLRELETILEGYRRPSGYDCIIPFSGGRDSCFVLHLAKNLLNLKPVTYTYDWGMVTDVGRRNIALMCGALGVENIVIADDIEKKRKNIAMNFSAWLKNPHLGMLNILTAGDKHFFKYVNQVKADTGVKLNLWGVNPLEVTHFKTGFLGIEPDFAKQRVYSKGKLSQLRYQAKRFTQMAKSPGYFNSSLWDTLSGEYYRSSAEKTDYFEMFNYWQWSESEVNDVLADYKWEHASDTPTTWRIGDGTAGIYNYIYYTLAGFTEHDTFRSNQIREGEISRDQALQLLENENSPCHHNIPWYLQSIGFNFSDTIKRINSIPRLHEGLY